MIKENEIQSMYNNGELKFTNLTTPHEHTPAVGFNYVYTTGLFIKTQEGPFPENNPYSFLIKPEEDNSQIKCVVPPESPAYDLARSFRS